MVSYYKSPPPPPKRKEREFLVKYFIYFRKVVCTSIMGDVERRLQIPILARRVLAMVSGLLFPVRDLNCGCVCTLQHVYAWPVVKDLVRIKFGVMARKVVTFGRHRVVEALCMTATLGNKFASLSDVNWQFLWLAECFGQKNTRFHSTWQSLSFVPKKFCNLLFGFCGITWDNLGMNTLGVHLLLFYGWGAPETNNACKLIWNVVIKVTHACGVFN